MELISAEWVVYGVEPGGAERHVMASSEGSFDIDADLVTRWLPTASTPADPAVRGALPRVWFAPTDDGEHMGVGATIPRAVRGADGRRLDPTTFLLVPWKEVLERRTGYQALGLEVLAAAKSYAGLQGEHNPRRLHLPPLDVVSQARAIDSYGFALVAGIAALVLDNGSVGLISARSLPMRERLTLLDAVAALLPYECRRRLVAGTWAEPKARYGLYFTGSRSAGHAHVDLDKRVVAAPRSFAASEYLAMLTGDLHKRHSLDGIVSHLVAVDRQSDELGVLQLLDRPHMVWRRVVKGIDVPIDEVRELLADGAHPVGLATSHVADLVAHLIRVGNADDVPIVAARLTDVTPLAETVRATLERKADVGWLIEVADSAGLREALLERLVSPPAPVEPPGVRFRTRGRRRMKRATVDDSVLVAVADLLRPADGDWPALRATLLDEPAMTYRVVARQVSGRGGLPAARATLTWLVGGAATPPTHLRVLDMLLGVVQPAPADIAALAPAVAAAEIGEVQAAVALADRLDRAWERYAGGGGPPDPDTARSAWNELRTLGDTRTTPSEQVQLDLLGYLVDQRPIGSLEQRLTGDNGAAYVLAFAEGFWSDPLDDDDRWHVTTHLARHVREQADWTTGPATAATLNLFGHLLAGLADHPLSLWRPHHLLDVVARGRLGTPALAELPAYQAFIGQDGKRPSDDPLAELGVLKQVHNDLDIRVLAARSARLLERGGTALAGQLLRSLDGSRHLATAQDVNDFLVHVWRERPTHVDVYWALVEAAHGDFLGAELVGCFGEFVRVTGEAEIRRWFRQLRTADMPPRLLRELLLELLRELPEDEPAAEER
jgi:hypothetical protein